MYYTENNHQKVVLRDFYLSRFENGPITEPCGTPEYLGRILSIALSSDFIHNCIPFVPLFPFFLCPSMSFVCFCEYRPAGVRLPFLSSSLPSSFENYNLSKINWNSKEKKNTWKTHTQSWKHLALNLLLPLLLSFHILWSPVYCLALGSWLSALRSHSTLWGFCEDNLECRIVLWPGSLRWKRSGQLFIMLSWVIRQINKRRGWTHRWEKTWARRRCKWELLSTKCRFLNNGLWWFINESCVPLTLSLSLSLPLLFSMLSLSSWSGGSSPIWSSCGLLGCGCNYVHTVSLLH